MKYAAIIRSDVWVPGDERSKTNPGHGYPGHTMETLKFKKFKNLGEMEEYVIRQSNSKYGSDDFTIIQYEEMVVEKKVQITVTPAR